MSSNLAVAQAWTTIRYQVPTALASTSGRRLNSSHAFYYQFPTFLLSSWTQVLSTTSTASTLLPVTGDNATLLCQQKDEAYYGVNISGSASGTITGPGLRRAAMLLSGEKAVNCVVNIYSDQLFSDSKPCRTSGGDEYQLLDNDITRNLKTNDNVTLLIKNGPEIELLGGLHKMQAHVVRTMNDIEPFLQMRIARAGGSG